MNGLRHPFSGAHYEQDGTGHILVTSSRGQAGLFTPKGKWVSGELEEADPQLCGWVAGPIVGNHRVTPSHENKSA
jgi:hypothetical protein